MKCKTFTNGRASTLEEAINEWLETQKNITIEYTNSLNCEESTKFSFIIFYSTRKDKLERIEQNNDD